MWKLNLNASLARRLGLGFASVLALLLCIAAVSTWALRQAGAQMTQVVEVNGVRSELANDLMTSIGDMATMVRTITMVTDVVAIDNEVKGLKEREKEYLRIEAALKANLDQYSAKPQESELFQKISEAGKQTLPMIHLAAQQGGQGDNVTSLLTLTQKVAPIEKVWRQNVAQFIAMQKESSGQAVQSSLSRQRQALLAQAILVLVSVLVGGFIAWRITSSVTTPINRAVVVAERIAKGDLTSTVEVRINDETGRLLTAMGAMQDRLRGLVGDIRQTANSIQVASEEVASGNLDLSQRTEQTSTSLQQAASSMDLLTGTVRQSADSARQANQLASSAAEVAARGGAVVSQVVTTMEDINASSKKIADIISVIDGIAFQTNILALNAAVEAARAGEQGRGFAVVAGEVRSLAGRSAEAAKEIKSLIGASVEKVEGGSRLVADAGKTMTEIVGSVQRVSDIIGEITAASSEQSDGISQVSGSVSQLDQMTQQNSALVEQSAAAAESLKEQAHNLTHMVDAFRLTREPQVG
ncbi:MAG: methyl-accepting chemotaxis protein [Pseudomonadota bacterium]|jgi:methyl-accepting chemotaxis protein